MDNDKVVNLRMGKMFDGLHNNGLIELTEWHFKMGVYFIGVIVMVFVLLYFYDKYLASRNTAS
jgi:hypothetical protein